MSEVSYQSLGDALGRLREALVPLNTDWTLWSRFREARNRMAHVYSEPVAEEIVSKIRPFLDEASYLYDQLASRAASA